MTALQDMIAGMDETWLILAAAGAAMVLLLFLLLILVVPVVVFSSGDESDRTESPCREQELVEVDERPKIRSASASTE